jgi:hypothetical protein
VQRCVRCHFVDHRPGFRPQFELNSEQGYGASPPSRGSSYVSFVRFLPTCARPNRQAPGASSGVDPAVAGRAITKLLHSLGAASIAGSLSLWARTAAVSDKQAKARAERLAIFVGLWPPTFFLLGKVLQDLDTRRAG